MIPYNVIPAQAGTQLPKSENIESWIPPACAEDDEMCGARGLATRQAARWQRFGLS